MRTSSSYETETLLEEYLLFHYGEEQDMMPFPFGPKDSLNFPIRCVTECLDVGALPQNAAGLDIGCAVGRTSFELARHCERVVAIDYSKSFINSAKKIQSEGQMKYRITGEGTERLDRVAKRPVGIDSSRIDFRCQDAMEFVKESNAFDVVIAANLICRLKDPLAFLKDLSNIVSKNGQLILTSPYSWLEEFTPRDYWLDSKKSPLDEIQISLKDTFALERVIDLPFLIREHYRKYQWGVSQASIWRKV